MKDILQSAGYEISGSPTRQPVISNYALQTGIKNDLLSPRRLGALNSRKPVLNPKQIIPPNPINPFSNPAQIPRANLSIKDSLPFLYTNESSLENFADATGNSPEAITDQITAVFNENKIDIIVGVVAVVMVIIAIVQIAKPV